MTISRISVVAMTAVGAALTLGILRAGSATEGTDPAQHLPIGVSPELYAIAVTTGRQPTPETAALGKRLFNDKRLSVDGTVACATCHDPAKGFVDARPSNATSAGVGGRHGARNAPTILNAMFQATEFWDGRSATLEEQAKNPIINPVEMGQKTIDDVVAKLQGIPEYATAFHTVYGRGVTADDLTSAVAAYERTLYSGNAPFDRFIAGNVNAISAPARRGWALFNGKARCADCHAFNTVSPLFSDQKFHNIGIAAHKQNFVALAREALDVIREGDAKQIDDLALETKYSELGRFLVTRKQGDIGAFKTETLRNIGITAPYMHDGSLKTLWDVVDHYNKGGDPNPYLDGGMQRLGLSESEIDDLVAFLFSLTDDQFAAYNKAEMVRQTALKTTRPQRDIAAVEGKKGDLGDVGPTPDLRNPASLGVY